MNHPSLRPALASQLLASLLVAGPAAAHAAPSPVAPSAILPKLDAKALLPKVKFSAGGKLSATEARIRVEANVAVAGRTFTVPVLDMGLARSKASVTVRRKVGKLKVKLKVSWSGERTVTIRGSATYAKIRVPMPKLRISL